MIGETLGHYKILDKLGEGGMGEVYRAEDTTLKRQVALKVLPPDLASSQERLERFQREAETLAALDHPNIVHIYTVEESEGERFLTMQLVEGKPLSELIPKDGLELDRFFDLAFPLADALRAAHEKGIIHRDLKPENVMVDEEGRVKVLDFGLAKLRLPELAPGDSELPTQAMTQEGLVLGTVPYMSPEQVQGQPVDHRTDLFSFGILLYEMLCGRRPFAGENTASLVSAIMRDEPEPVREVRKGLPAPLAELVAECLQKDPQERIQSAGDVRDRLHDIRREVESGQVVLSQPAGAPSKERPPNLRFLLPALIVVIVVILGVLTWRNRAAAPVETPGPQIASLVVLPLQNLSGNPEQDYIADGMTEALITNLSKISALKVISRTSAMRYKDSEKTLPEIANELGVDAVIEGSVLREADQVRINAQLIDAATDQNVWADSYERGLESVLALQTEVARAIAEEIEVTITPEEASRLAESRKVNPETYEAYLRGMHSLNRGTSEDFAKGIEYLNEAIDKDPADPLAYAGLALGYIRIGHDTGPSELYFPRAVAAANRALKLDDSNAMAHAALAEAKMYYEWDWKGARASFERALELDPNLAGAHLHFSYFHAIFGRWDDALMHGVRAEQLDPLSPLHPAGLAGIYWMAGQLDQAIPVGRKALELFPGFAYGWSTLAWIYSSAERHEEALEASLKASALNPDWGWVVAQAQAAAGHGDEARQVLADYERLSEADPLGVASARASLGETEEAIQWLEAAFAARHRWLPWINVMPNFHVLEADPRFQDLLRRMNFPE